jgi:hypothetical protein
MRHASKKEVVLDKLRKNFKALPGRGTQFKKTQSSKSGLRGKAALEDGHWQTLLD